MIKLMACGIWVCTVALACAYASAGLWPNGFLKAEAEAQATKREVFKPGQIAVPIIADGVLKGHVIARFAFTVKSKEAQQLPVAIDGFLVDEAFRSVYGAKDVDFTHMKRQDLTALAKTIALNVNNRLGSPVVEDVLIQELTYMPKEPGAVAAGGQ
ncbi:MAG: hypothetical protein SGJ17_14710 [Hyphomicrobiales bacterium]|nr:hypothetical protein [Hyphomicrobiales bacterium]